VSIVGILCCTVILTIGLEIKEGRLSPSARQQASPQLSSEGLVLRNLEESINTDPFREPERFENHPGQISERDRMTERHR